MRINDPATPQDALRTMRAIGVALCGAVALFALTAWWVHREAPPLPADGPWIFYVWVAFATSLAAASMVFWRGNVVPLIDRPASDADWRDRAGRVQTGLVICWSLVEAAALFGVVVYFIDGVAPAAAMGIAMICGAVAITWPRESWLATGSTISG